MTYTQHPCVEVVGGKPQLKIFNYFYKELTLPKYRKDTSTSIHPDTLWMMDSMSRSASTESGSSWGSNDNNNDLYIKSLKRKFKRSWSKKIKDWFSGKPDPVETTFNKIKNAKGELSEDLEDMLHVVEKLATRAAKNNQLALVDELKKRMSVIIGEMCLSKNGYLEYVSEEKMIEFFLKSDKGVRIDFIRNYTSIIPFPVAEKKDKLDELKVFDNYCIAHYDPNTAVFRVSQEDRNAQKRRDPILFGMIEGSRRLYYVGDWVTDDDTLTLEELNLVVENATSRLHKLQESMPTVDDIMATLKNVTPVD